MLKNFLKYYLPAFFWAGIIFYFSSISGLGYSQNITEEIILRKGAHFVEYAILALLIWRIFYRAHGLNLKKSFIYSLAFSSLYALSDEWHQSFIAERSGQFMDAIYDFFSALAALSFVAMFFWQKKRKKMLIIFLLSGLILIWMETIMIRNSYESINLEKTISEKKPNNMNIISNKEVEKEKQNVENEKKIPDKILINVPFTSQAPFAVWDEFHEEACEEASIIMLKYYLDGEKLSASEAEKEVQNLITYQIKNYGDFKDTNVAETAKLASEFYGMKNLKIVYDFYKDDLKKYLAKGQPIIIPVAGRLLGNPFFTSPGPLYHNLILVGYDDDEIITNDPGTKRGEGHRYDIDVLYNAIHDFTGDKENIEKGQKAMIVVE